MDRYLIVELKNILEADTYEQAQALAQGKDCAVFIWNEKYRSITPMVTQSMVDAYMKHRNKE